MATLKYYLQNAAAGYTPSQLNGTWDQSSVGATKALGLAQYGASAYVSASVLGYESECLLRCVGPALASQHAFSVGDGWEGVIGALGTIYGERLRLSAWVSVGDSDTVRGWLIANRDDTDDLVSVESTCGEDCSGQIEETFIAEVGDRIILEIGIHNTHATLYTGYRVYYGGGIGGSLGDGEDPTYKHGWIQFDYVVPSAVDVDDTITLTDSIIDASEVTYAAPTDSVALAESVAVSKQPNSRTARVAEEAIVVTRSDRTVVGVVNADVTWTRVLDGPDRLDRCTIPKWWLKANGMRVSKPDLRKLGWCVKHDGIWFSLDRVKTDNITSITFTGRSIEASELSRVFSSVGRNGFVRVANTPTEIMDDLLSGEGALTLGDPGIETTTGSGGTDRANISWRGEQLEDTDEFEAQCDAVFDQDRLSGSIWGNYDGPQLDESGESGSTYYLSMMYCPPQSAMPTSSYYWSGFAPTDWFAAPSGGQFRVSAEFGLHAYWYASGAPSENWTNAPDMWDEADAAGIEVTMEFWWYASDQETVLTVDRYPVSGLTTTRTRKYFPSAATYVTAKGDWLKVVLAVYVPKTANVIGAGTYGSFFYADDFEIEGVNLVTPSGWTYSGSMDTRDTDILHTDPYWIETGTWTVGANDRYCSIKNNQLAYIITGPTCTIHFGDGEAGSICNIIVDDEVEQTNLDVSSATSYAITGLDTDVEHIVSVKLKADKKVAVQKLVVDAERRISVTWSDMSALDCVDALLQAVGGEIDVDTENRIIEHSSVVGIDLRANNVIELVRGQHLLNFDLLVRRDTVVNKLLYLGYGDGTTRLRIVVDAVGTNEDGDTSQDVYGVQWGKLENPDCQDWYLGVLEAREALTESEWPAEEYLVESTDTAASYMCPGDTVRCYWDDDPDDIIDESLRILDITRHNQGGPAKLVVGTRVTQLPDRLAATARKIDGISRNL